MTGPLDAQQAQAFLTRADELAAAGDFEGAAPLYSRVVGNAEPGLHVAALLGLADSRYRVDDEEGALQAWIVATQAPENPLSWRAWVALAGARVRQGDLSGATRCYREAERRAPVEERNAIAARLGWLNKEMGNDGAAQRYFGRSRPGSFTPFLTYAMLAVTVVSSVVAMSSPDLLDVLQLDKERVQAGEWWRLVTVALVHDPRSYLHLLFNMYALYIAGPLVEAMYGRVLYATFYVLAAAAGSVASYLVFPNPSVGASGAIFGLFGLIAVASYVHRPALGRQARALTSQIAVLIVINLAIGFGVAGLGGGIDNAAHVGGLVAGAWLGLTVVPRGTATLRSMWQQTEAVPGSDPRLRNVLQVGAVVALALVLLLALGITPMWGT